MKKSHREKILLVLVFLIGLSIFTYPALSDYIARRNVIQSVNDYDKVVINLSDEEIAKMWERARGYNDNLKGDPVVDPFIMGSGRVLPEDYLEILSMEDSIMGYIDIPSINVYQPIRHDTSEEVLKKGAGHIEQTALPIGGEGNMPVITAHTGFAGADMFNRLTELKVDDIFLLHILDETLTYQVDDVKVILPEDVESLIPIEDKDYVVLMTCTPYGVNSHRLLVRGIRIANLQDIVREKDQVPFPWRLFVMVTVAVLLFVLVLIWNHKRNKKEEGAKET